MIEKSAQELHKRISFLEKKLEEKCTKNDISDQFKHLLETSADSFYCRNLLNNNYDFISKSIYNVLGYTSTEFINLPLETVIGLVHPDDKVILDTFFERILQITTKPETTFSIEYRIKNKTRNYRWVSERISIVRDPLGSPIKLLGNLRDITDTKEVQLLLSESEQLYRNLIDHVLDKSYIGIFILDKNFKIVWINSATELFFNINRNDVIGKDKKQIIESKIKNNFENPEFFKKKVFATYDDNTYTENFECHVLSNKTRKDRWLYHWSQPIKSGIYKNGRIEQYTDITERKLAKEQILANESRLKELNDTKDKFFSIIAHDLKSPFSSIIGFSELLIKQVENKQYDKINSFSNIILSESKRSMELLTNLLDWSRSQTGIIKFNPENINITKIISNCIDLLQANADQKNIKIKYKYSKEIYVLGDKNMLHTVIRNLICNSIKFTNNNGIVEIEAITADNNLIISVSDNGIGIPNNVIRNLFKIDKTISTDGTNNEKGTGLGLILSKEFIEKHRGTINVKSKIGKGTTFFFEIPLK